MIHPTIHRKIQHFLAVGDSLSFRKAAQALRIAQPALSRSIRQLEQQLGFPLFQRSTRHVAMTPAGRLLYTEGIEAVRRLAQACARASKVAQGLSGTIVVGYSTFAATGPMSSIIIDFRRKYPDAHVSLRLLASSEQVSSLEEGSLDVGFMMSYPSTAPFRSIPISKERLVALVPDSHAWATRRSLTLKQLSSAPIVFGTPSRWRGFRSLVEEITTAQGLALNIVEEADDVPVLLQLVRSGFGCTILDASFIPTLPPGIKPVEIRDVSATLDISLTWRGDSISPLAAHFVQVARTRPPRSETTLEEWPRANGPEAPSASLEKRNRLMRRRTGRPCGRKQTGVSIGLQI